VLTTRWLSASEGFPETRVDKTGSSACLRSKAAQVREIDLRECIVCSDGPLPWPNRSQIPQRGGCKGFHIKSLAGKIEQGDRSSFWFCGRQQPKSSSCQENGCDDRARLLTKHVIVCSSSHSIIPTLVLERAFILSQLETDSQTCRLSGHRPSR